MSEDWVEDPNLSSEEKLIRFRSLAPAQTRGPRLIDAVQPESTGTIGSTYAEVRSGGRTIKTVGAERKSALTSA